MQQHREAAISARAYELWIESGHAHGQDRQHWSQAEREHDESQVRSAVTAPTVIEAATAKPARKKAAKTAAVSPAVAAKARTSRKGPAAARLN